MKAHKDSYNLHIDGDKLAHEQHQWRFQVAD